VYGVTTVLTFRPPRTWRRCGPREFKCLGVGPAADLEDGAKGFGAHSDQERFLESELHRLDRFIGTS
jgi:hypothetical protein